MDSNALSETLKSIDIISVFKEEPFSVIPTSEIERRLGLSHHPTFRRLKILEGHSIVLKHKGGYSLNLQNEAVHEIMRFLSNIDKINQKDRSER